MIANIDTLVRVAPTILGNPVRFLGKKKYIFVVSHMRSYSSLLSHILGSHGEISGYAEMKQSYSSWTDFIRLRHKVYMANGNRLDGGYVLDKILHNSHTISETILDQGHVRLVFLLRNPEVAMKSIINMGKTGNFGNAEWVLDYYLGRLKQLQDYARTSNGRMLFVDSETIIEGTDYLLDYLSDWLELGSKLTAKYSNFEYTGAPRYGDPSSFIKRGRIVRTPKDYHSIHIPSEMIRRAEDAYDACRRTLLQYSDTI